MCVPRKPHPFGNEYHTICDGELDGHSSPILWHAEIQEGKDRPLALGPKKFDEKGKTVGLMCRMVEPIKSSGKCITMDSGFNVSMGIVDMERVQGVYGQALIKKRGRYWPKGVPGDFIDEHFRNKEIGHSETLELVFDGHPFLIHCTKGLFIILISKTLMSNTQFDSFIIAEEGYVTKFMSTFGCLNVVGGHNAYRTLKDGTQVRWVYIEPTSRHNRAKHWVDDVNNRRHAPIDLAEAWRTKWWPNRQFTFFLSVAEVNAVNSRARARGVEGDAGLDFRRNLAVQMLENNLDQGFNNRSPIRAKNTRARASISAGEGTHAIMNRPYFTSKWLGSSWKKAKDKYHKTPCACGNRCRTHCLCDKGKAMCVECFNIHILNV